MKERPSDVLSRRAALQGLGIGLGTIAVGCGGDDGSIPGPDGAGSGTQALNTRAPGWVFAGNIVTGVRASAYPSGNFYPSTLGAVGFVSVSGRDYRLASSSAYDGRATDGTDPGANVSRVQTATAGVAK